MFGILSPISLASNNPPKNAANGFITYCDELTAPHNDLKTSYLKLPLLKERVRKVHRGCETRVEQVALICFISIGAYIIYGAISAI